MNTSDCRTFHDSKDSKRALRVNSIWSCGQSEKDGYPTRWLRPNRLGICRLHQCPVNSFNARANRLILEKNQSCPRWFSYMLFGSSEALNLADLRMTLASMCRRSSRQYLFTTAGEVNCTNHQAEWNTSKCNSPQSSIGEANSCCFSAGDKRTPFHMIHFTDDVDIILP